MRQSLCHLCAGLLTGARQVCFHQVILQRKFPLSLLVFECKASSFPSITVQGLRGAQPVFLPHNASCMRVLPVALVIPFPSRLFTAEICAIACAMSPCWLSCSTAVCRANRHRGSAAEGRGSGCGFSRAWLWLSSIYNSTAPVGVSDTRPEELLGLKWERRF